VQRFRGVLVFKVHRLCVSPNSRLESRDEVKKTWTFSGAGPEQDQKGKVRGTASKSPFGGSCQGQVMLSWHILMLSYNAILACIDV